MINSKIRQLRNFTFTAVVLLLLIGCSQSISETPVEETPQLAETAVPTTAAAEVPTEIPSVEPEPTQEPEVEQPSDFVDTLKAAITNQDYDQLLTLVSDPIGVGAWRSEWRELGADEFISQLQSGALPALTEVSFSDASQEALNQMLGQPPASMLGPDVQVVEVLHSTGWGPSGDDEAILFVTDESGQPVWSAFLYTSGGFSLENSGSLPAPNGLIYKALEQGIMQIGPEGQHVQLLDAEMAMGLNLQIAPDGRHAVYYDDSGRVWLIDTSSGMEEQIAAEYDLSSFFVWGDSDTLLVGVWLNPDEKEGPNNGHTAIYDIGSGSLNILDEQLLSSNRPDYLSDYTMTAFDVIVPSDNARIHHPDSGTRVFDPTSFDAEGAVLEGLIFNPAISSDSNQIAWLVSAFERFALQLFNRDESTVRQVFDWDPARFGAMVPSPDWSPDDQWLALEVWANNPDESGMWVIAADGSNQFLVEADMIDFGGRNPLWINDSQLVFNSGTGPRIYDVSTQEQFGLDLPENSFILNFLDPQKLLAEDVEEEPTPSALPQDLPDPLSLPLAGEQTLPSPNGDGEAVAAWTEPTTAEEQEVYFASLTASAGNTAWAPIEEWRNYGLGYTWPRIVRWSDDGRFLYYTNDVSPDGCAIFVAGTDLHQLDMENGQVTELIPPGQTMNFALAPDQSAVAYIHFDGGVLSLVVDSLRDGSETQMLIDENAQDIQAGNIFWSPDNSKVYLVVAHDACSPDQVHSIMQVDFSTSSLTALVDKDPRQFNIVGGPEEVENELVLRDSDGEAWLLDTETGEMTPQP